MKIKNKIARLSFREKKAQYSGANWQESMFTNCPVCGKKSNQVGTLGFSKKYECGECGYKFSNR